MLDSFNRQAMVKDVLTIWDGLSLAIKYGLVLAVALIAYDGVQKIFQATQAQREQRQFFELQNQRMLIDSDPEQWIGRADEVEAAAGMWSQRRWQSETPGVSAAQIQQVLNQIGRANDINFSRVTIDPSPVTLPNGEQLLRFTVGGTASDGERIAKLLAEIANSNPALYVDELGLRFSNKMRVTFNLEGGAPFSSSSPSDALVN